MIQDGVILFYTSSAALRAEKTLQRAQLRAKLIPTPREFSSDCGIALRFAWPQVESVRAALEASRVETVAIHQMERG